MQTFGDSVTLDNLVPVSDAHSRVAETKSIKSLCNILMPIMELSVLAAVDSELAAQMRVWLELQWDDSLPSATTTPFPPILSFIIDALDINVSHYKYCRTLVLIMCRFQL